MQRRVLAPFDTQWSLLDLRVVPFDSTQEPRAPICVREVVALGCPTPTPLDPRPPSGDCLSSNLGLHPPRCGPIFLVLACFDP
jgi:hypothetical protein